MWILSKSSFFNNGKFHNSAQVCDGIAVFISGVPGFVGVEKIVFNRISPCRKRGVLGCCRFFGRDDRTCGRRRRRVSSNGRERSALSEQAGLVFRRRQSGGRNGFGYGQRRVLLCREQASPNNSAAINKIFFIAGSVGCNKRGEYFTKFIIKESGRNNLT